MSSSEKFSPVRNLIEARFGTQKQFAARLGRGEVFVSRWLNGKDRFSPETLSQAAALLGIPLDELRRLQEAGAGSADPGVTVYSNVRRGHPDNLPRWTLAVLDLAYQRGFSPEPPERDRDIPQAWSLEAIRYLTEHELPGLEAELRRRRAERRKG